MSFLKKSEYDAVMAVYDLLKDKKSAFCGSELETLNTFFSEVETMQERRKTAQIKHAEATRAYRRNPETREKALEIDRRALKKYRSKKPE